MAGLVWITVPGTARGRPAWKVWQQSAVYVLTGGSEQSLPGLVEAEYAEVTVPSKDSGGRLITWTARVMQVRPGTDEWLLLGREPLDEACPPLEQLAELRDAQLPR